MFARELYAHNVMESNNENRNLHKSIMKRLMEYGKVRRNSVYQRASEVSFELNNAMPNDRITSKMLATLQ